MQASGLSSPYPYLWTLPAQVDDPKLDHLTALLAGPNGPTWLVSWDRPSFAAPVLRRFEDVVAGRYREVGVVCGHPIFLRDGVVRPTPPAETCVSPFAATPQW